MSVELIIFIGVCVLGVAMLLKHRAKPVDMNHKAPNVHNVVSKGTNGPAPAAKKTTKKKTTKKKSTKKKTSKKTASKK